MKNLVFILSFIFYFSQLSAQYYYTDIIGTNQTNNQYRLIKNNRLTKISATSFEANSQPSADFTLVQTVLNNYQQILTHSASITGGESYFKSYYLNNKLTKTVDSSNNAINTVSYEYDSKERVTTVSSLSKDFDGTFVTTETHYWTYNNEGLPEKMLKLKNIKDTTIVTFTYEDGAVAEEKWKKNNRIIETYYYYYNPKKQLTDIVRFNRKAKQMLPDYLFEYNEEGHINQMTQTQNTTANYLIWKYIYNIKGLKEKEFVFNKQKELLGRMEYSYQ